MKENNEMTFEEGLKMVYVPIVLTYAAFENITYGLKYAAQARMPWKARSRKVKEWMTEYKSNVFQAIGAELMPEIRERVDALRDHGDECFDNLRLELKKELMREHGVLIKDNWRMYSNLLIALMMLRYAVKYEVVSSKLIQAKTGRKTNMVDECVINIVNELVYMVKGYNVEITEGITSAMKGIANVMDVLTDVKIVNR